MGIDTPHRAMEERVMKRLLIGTVLLLLPAGALGQATADNFTERMETQRLEQRQRNQDQAERRYWQSEEFNRHLEQRDRAVENARESSRSRCSSSPPYRCW